MLYPHFKITDCDLESLSGGAFEITKFDFKRDTSSQVSRNVKSSGNRSIFRLTA